MLMTISGQNVRVPATIKAYTAAKVSQLPKYYGGLSRVNVTLRRESPGKVNARIIALGKRRRCFVMEETAHNAYDSITKAVRNLERQLSRLKERTRNRKHNRKAMLPGKAWSVGNRSIESSQGSTEGRGVAQQRPISERERGRR